MRTSIRKVFLFIFVLTLSKLVFGQVADSTVTDFDGNVYNIILIGNQTWLKENLKSIHYSDGTEIPRVVAYNNDVANAEIYGRLYTWDAAMNNSTEKRAQGVCPCEWHIPSDSEWRTLEVFLGGENIAGGKMKEVGMTYWKFPNTGANNESGLTILPGGEYDAYYTPNKFSLIKDYAVFWTSTEVSATKAKERYLAYSDAKSSIYDWYKVMKYSIRCVKDSVTTDVNTADIINPSSFNLHQNYPNPFNPSTKITFSIPQSSNVKLQIFDITGSLVKTLVNSNKNTGNYSISWNGKNNLGNNANSGIYFYRLLSKDITISKKMILVR